MNLADEIERLAALRERGLLSEDEFQRAKTLLLAGEAGFAPGTAPAAAAINGLRRSRSDRWIAGVCAGVAKALGVESWLLRLIVVLLALFGGTGLFLYLLLWLFVPNE
jgi:phage shock protein PspC (stress-responsive transcriptional regulator)